MSLQNSSLHLSASLAALFVSSQIFGAFRTPEGALYEKTWKNMLKQLVKADVIAYWKLTYPHQRRSDSSSLPLQLVVI